MPKYGVWAVTDADRDAVAEQLREHYATGRLSLDEFQRRLDAVYRAQTARELGAVTDSLPREGVAIRPGAPWGSYPAGYASKVARRRAALARTGRRVMLALGVLRGLSQAGLSVPGDLAVVGYDDIEFAADAAVPLTSVRQPKYQLGRAAAELLLDEADHPAEHEHRRIVFTPELVVRASSGSPATIGESAAGRVGRT